MQTSMGEGVQADSPGWPRCAGHSFLRFRSSAKVGMATTCGAWTRLPDRTDKTVAAMASASMSVRLGDGSAALFWTDKWTSAGTLSTTLAPNLFAVITRAGRRRTVRDALLGNRWARDIAGATTVQMLCQFLKVWELTREVVLDPLQSDRFVWKWSADGRYSASSTYRAFFLGSTSLLGARELWRTRAPPRVKFFGWLALHRRLWTAERRMRHGLQANNDCSLCGQAAETVEHMLLGCVLVRQLWHSLLQPIGLAALTPDRVEDIPQWWLAQRRRIERDARPMFDSMFLLLAWNVWKHRNGIVFQRWPSPDLTRLRSDTIREAQEWHEADVGCTH